MNIALSTLIGAIVMHLFSFINFSTWDMYGPIDLRARLIYYTHILNQHEDEELISELV